MRGHGWCIGWLWLLLLASPLATADGADAFRTKFPREIIDRPPVLVSARVDKGPTIDGEVDRDPVWSQLPRSAHTEGAWTQLGTKNVSGRQTVVYSCYDRQNLYFGFVCEEPELQNVQMDGDVGAGDAVEVAIEVNGLRGEGQVCSFLANSRACSPGCKAAGKFGPNRWMVEMAIPFASLERRADREGPTVPSRGDVIGLKLARYGAVQQKAASRMVSSWNINIAYPYLHICGSNGLLYFDDSNAMMDGGFLQSEAQSPWKRAGEVATRPSGTGTVISLGVGATLIQTVSVHRASYYVLRAESEGANAPEVLIDGMKLDLKDGQAGVWIADKQDTAVVTVRAAGPLTLKNIAMEYQPGEEPSGPYCLTNNHRRPGRNIRALLPDAPEGGYRYVRIDYAGRVTDDDNPAIPVSTGHSWAYDHSLRVEDLGGKAGWIPMDKGSLTGRHKPVFWNPANPGDPVCWGRHPVVIDVDLGQEYFVSGLDILWPGPHMINVEAWGKARDADEWTLLSMSEGPYVAPAERRPRRGYDRLRGVDSVIRYVRWRVTPAEGDASYPQLDGIQEFMVWDLPKAQHTGIKAFKPWLPNKQTPPVTGQTAVLDGDAPLIVPRPRNMVVEDGWFLVNCETRIVTQDHVEARRVARQVHDEVLDRWQMDLPVVVEGTAAAAGQNVFYLGLPRLGDVARQVAREEGLSLDADKPQGYGLRITPKRVAVVGNDSEGLYYGVQSLMMAMRWRNAPGGGSPGVRCMKVLDWPGTVLERGLYQRRPYPVMMMFPESDIGRIKRMCRLLSRFKYNVIYLGPIYDDPLVPPRMKPWARKLLPQLCREVREEYHVEVRPTILYEEGEGGSYWLKLSNDAPDIREHDPDEDPRELGQSANLCPLDERTYQRHFAKIDEILDDFGHPSKVWMFGQAYTSVQNGARWAQCRRCQKSGKSPEQLYAYFISRIAQHLEERQTKGLFRCPWVRFGDTRDPKDRRLISIDPRDLPKNLVFDMWDREDPFYTAFNRGRPFITQHFTPSRTANGPADWASSERYLQDAPQSETEMLVGLSGSSAAVWGQVVNSSSLSDVAEDMWYSPDRRPAGRLNDDELSDFVFRWWFGYDFPAWRAGDRPKFFPLNLRPFANHTSAATGAETLESGRPPEIDLRYLPKGPQTLAGVPFDVIDPAQNDGKGLLMLGRPAPGTLPKVTATIQENAGPIPVGRKLASLAFLRIRWHCRTEGMSFEDTWLRPTCRVVYEDDSWLTVDSFLIWHAGLFADEWNNIVEVVRPYYRLGWSGNSPKGDPVTLFAMEWVNPYPDKTIKYVEFVTPEFSDVRGKRVSDMMEAIAAITGVAPTAHDLAFWKDRPARSPLLPPRKGPSGGVELRAVGDLQWRGDGTCVCGLRTPTEKVQYVVKPMEKSGYCRNFNEIYDLVYCDVDFRDFGAEVVFEKPLALQRIEIRGPTSLGEHWGPFAPRTKKADVTVEVSEDGKAWRKAGVLRGLSADADFMPVDLGIAAVKAIRMTGTAQPYREDYHPVQVQGDIFWSGQRHYNPSFVWRLFAPTEQKAP